MKKLVYLFIVSLTAIGLMGCSSEKITSKVENEKSKEVSVTPVPKSSKDGAAVTKAATSVTKTEGSVVEAQIQSEAIAKNVIGTSKTRTIYIYLPPSYNSTKKTYPVVYFLHGYGDSPKAFMQSYQTKLDKQFNSGAQEFILVALDGNNNTGGSFYVNSPAIGNWEDYIVNELVTYMDKNYRTIANSNSRGLSGYSMGGFGALYISLRHPEVFNSVLVFCPGVFAENDLDSVLKSWTGWTDVNKSYAQAFSPDINNTTDYGNIIKPSDVKAKNSIWEDWMNGYSNWGKKLDDYLALNKPLKSIKITYSKDDNFSWIPGGCDYLAELLKEKKINYSTENFAGGHIVPSNAIEKYFIPFFGDNLSY